MNASLVRSPKARRQRRLGLLLIAGAAATLSLLLVAAAGAKPIVFGVKGVVTRIAADGSRVALEVTKKGSCDRVIAWNATSKAFTGWTTGACGATPLSGVPEVAIGGTTVGWIEAGGGNNQELTFNAATIGKAAVKKSVLFVTNGNGAGGDKTGEYIGHLFGNGSALALNQWTVCHSLAPGAVDEESMAICKTPGVAGTDAYLVDSPVLKTYSGGAVKSVVSNGHTYQVSAVNNGRIAVAFETGQVPIYSLAGALQTTIPIPAGTVSGAALYGDQYFTIRNGALEVYSMTALVKSIPITASKPNLRAATDKYAVYVSGSSVHVVRISDGKDITLSTGGTPGAPADGMITSSGLFYASNVMTNKTAPGRVTFIPAAAIAGLF